MTPKLTLYVILGSHACRSASLMLEHKRISHRRVTVPTGLHPFAVRLAGFPANEGSFREVDGRYPAKLALADRMGTVPALRAGEEQIKTNREIARFLDRLQPDPPLLPADVELRARVEEAEAWADTELQMTARRLVLAAGVLGHGGLIDDAGTGRLGPLLWRHGTVRRVGVRVVGRAFAVDEQSGRRLAAALPAMLDRIDEWIADGVLGAERMNVADLMVAPSLALLCYRRDLRAEIERRPLRALVDRLLPDPAAAGRLTRAGPSRARA